MFRQLKSAVGNPEALWFMRTATGSVILGYSISEYVLTDEVLAPVYSRMSVYGRKVESFAKEWLPMPIAHAFSTPDHGLHAPHYPFEFKKWWATYDHAAYSRLI